MMISYYFSPHRGVNEWNKDNFITLVDNVSTLHQYVCKKSLKDRLAGKLGTKINVSKKLNADVDFIMKFECLDDDFKLVCKRLEIPYSPLLKRNVSDREHYSKYYDDELREIVSNKFIKEIEFGNYSFESD